jgi:hypothetical protein
MTTASPTPDQGVIATRYHFVSERMRKERLRLYHSLLFKQVRRSKRAFSAGSSQISRRRVARVLESLDSCPFGPTSIKLKLNADPFRSLCEPMLRAFCDPLQSEQPCSESMAIFMLVLLNRFESTPPDPWRVEPWWHGVPWHEFGETETRLARLGRRPARRGFLIDEGSMGLNHSGLTANDPSRCVFAS